MFSGRASTRAASARRSRGWPSTGPWPSTACGARSHDLFGTAPVYPSNGKHSSAGPPRAREITAGSTASRSSVRITGLAERTGGRRNFAPPGERDLVRFGRGADERAATHVVGAAARAIQASRYALVVVVRLSLSESASSRSDGSLSPAGQIAFFDGRLERMDQTVVQALAGRALEFSTSQVERYNQIVKLPTS